MKLFKRTGFAVLVTAMMILLAVGIGLARRPGRAGHIPTSEHAPWYVSDQAGVLPSSVVKQLESSNRSLDSSMGVVIGYLTCNYGNSDLANYAMEQAEEMGLGDNDFMVVLDISGDTYWLMQGNGLAELFSDDDCVAYAHEYMNQSFSQGDYAQALVSITDALSQWYGSHYLGG